MATTIVLFKNRSFTRLLAAQFLALSAVYALNLSTVVLVELETHSSIQTGIVILTITVPGTAASLAAGPLVDRFSRKATLIFAHLLKGVVAGMFFLALRFFKGFSLLLSAYLVNVFLSILNQFTSPTEAAMLPALVRREHLIRANSVFQVSSLLAQGAGAILVGPLLVKFLGLQYIPLAALFFSALATVNAFFLPGESALARAGRRSASPVGVERIDFWKELKRGWEWIAGDRLTRTAVFQLSLATLIMLSLSTLLPGFVYRTMGWDASRFPLMVIPVGAGFLAGILLLNRCSRQLLYEEWVCYGLLGLGASISAIALSGGRLPGFLGLSAMAAGAGLALVFIPAKTLLQERPPAHLRGRVFSTQYLVVNISSVGVTLFSGGLADLLGIRAAMFLLGLAALGGGMLSGRGSAAKPQGPGERPGE